MKQCTNCGEEFKIGEGHPENEFECCCSMECWVEFVEYKEVNNDRY